MTQQVRLAPLSRGLLIASAIAILIFLAQSAQAILVPFLLAVFLAAIAGPPVLWLTRHRVPHVVAVVLAAVSMMLVLSLVGTIVGASVTAFTARVPTYEQRLLTELTRWYDQFGAAAPETLRDLIPALEPGAAMGIAASVLTGLSGVLGNMFLILFTMIFILLEARTFQRKLDAAFGHSDEGLDVFWEFMDKLLRYLEIKTVMSLATGVLVFTWVWSMGVDFPVMWGLLAFLLNYVPTIGSILAAVPPVLLSVIQFGPGKAAGLAMGYLVINIFVSNVVEPRVMGRGLGLSPLVVFLSLVFWGWVLGPVGMFLSVPMTMTLRIALQANDGTRWLSVLLGPADGSADPGGAAAAPASPGP
jgi:predicted PurR-regulated permease PerM